MNQEYQASQDREERLAAQQCAEGLKTSSNVQDRWEIVTRRLNNDRGIGNPQLADTRERRAEHGFWIDGRMR